MIYTTPDGLFQVRVYGDAKQKLIYINIYIKVKDTFQWLEANILPYEAIVYGSPFESVILTDEEINKIDTYGWDRKRKKTERKSL
jgi:hypothetical protein